MPAMTYAMESDFMKCFVRRPGPAVWTRRSAGLESKTALRLRVRSYVIRLERRDTHGRCDRGRRTARGRPGHGRSTPRPDGTDGGTAPGCRGPDRGRR